MDKRADLKSISQVPPHLAFNKYVLYGYRVNYNLAECLRSLFFLHNETVNVYTHVLMALLAVLVVPKTIPDKVLEGSSPVLIALHLVACIFPFVASTAYHLFMCHEHGASLYKILLLVDMFGVWISNTFGFIIPIWVVSRCNFLAGTSFLIFYLSMSCCVLYYILAARTSKERYKPLTFFAAARPCFLIFRYLQTNQIGDIDSLWYYFLVDILVSIGGTINVSRLPERWMPGLFDYFFNSHQLMHLFVMCGIWSLNTAALKDLNWMIDNSTC